MKDLRRVSVIVPAAALLLLTIAWVMTRGAMEQLAFLRQGKGEQGLVDQRPYTTAITLAPLAVSAEEQNFAQQAVKLSDHEVDQAFAMALRLSMMQKRVLAGEALELDAKVTALRQTVADDKAKVDALTAEAARTGVASSEGDDLDVAKAQLGLDNDELTDATGDLARASGDTRTKIEQELQARDAAQKKAGATNGDTAVVTAKKYGTLWGQGNAWFAQRSRADLIGEAERRARDDAKALQTQHDQLEKASGSAATQMKTTAAIAGTARVKMLQRMGAQRAIMSILDDRIQGEQQLAAIYQSWQAQVWVQHRIVGHLLLQSLAWIALVVLLTALATLSLRLVLSKFSSDNRRTQTLETIFGLAFQVIGVLLVLLVIFGPPQQMPTILGLATAGLTVVFQDFILAFFGWFVIMGGNGIRVGDWVEIDGVGGEVSEIGLFRTMLLETENWTSLGHPTGRRVTFTNSFAIRGKYFNFSTHGQWMWDEIKVSVPSAANAYAVIGLIQKGMDEEALKNTDAARAELSSVSGRSGISLFDVAPTVDVRPGSSGIELIVRFVTRANERFELRGRLNETIMRILEEGEKDAAAAPNGAA